jgi:predicted flap endonuclease-1-like 5' DNA nuclease
MRHPLNWLVGRYGEPAALVAGVAIVIGASMVTPDGHIAPSALLVAMVALWATAQRGDDRRTEVDTAQRAYVEGDIDLEEYEARLELILDEEASRIREVVEDVRGVGPETSADLALEFETVDDLRGAAEPDLRKIHGIGPKTAEKIVMEVCT